MVYFMEHSIKAIHEKEQAAAGGGGGTSPEDKERITKLEDELEDLLPAWTKAGPKGDGSHEVGEACTHDGQSWRCCQAHNTNNNPDIEPGKSPAQWVPYHTTDPKKAKPFIQPTMAEDSYQKGEVCIWTDGKVYRSIMETANAYSPEAYPQGWEVVEVEDGGAA